jgi:hypothetical protein
MRAVVNECKHAIVIGAKNRNRQRLAGPLHPSRTLARNILDPANLNPAVIGHRLERLCPDGYHYLFDHAEPHCG